MMQGITPKALDTIALYSISRPMAKLPKHFLAQPATSLLSFPVPVSNNLCYGVSTIFISPSLPTFSPNSQPTGFEFVLCVSVNECTQAVHPLVLLRPAPAGPPDSASPTKDPESPDRRTWLVPEIFRRWRGANACLPQPKPRPSRRRELCVSLARPPGTVVQILYSFCPRHTVARSSKEPQPLCKEERKRRREHERAEV